MTPATTIAAAYCGQKRAYRTREDAEAQAARHHSCQVCADGRSRMEAYPCGDHFHTGHMGVRR